MNILGLRTVTGAAPTSLRDVTATVVAGQTALKKRLGLTRLTSAEITWSTGLKVLIVGREVGDIQMLDDVSSLQQSIHSQIFLDFMSKR